MKLDRFCQRRWNCTLTRLSFRNACAALFTLVNFYGFKYSELTVEFDKSRATLYRYLNSAEYFYRTSQNFKDTVLQIKKHIENSPQRKWF